MNDLLLVTSSQILECIRDDYCASIFILLKILTIASCFNTYFIVDDDGIVGMIIEIIKLFNYASMYYKKYTNNRQFNFHVFTYYCSYYEIEMTQ